MVVWRQRLSPSQAVLVRCAQPQAGLLASTCTDDENFAESLRLLSQITQETSVEMGQERTTLHKKIQLIDARPKVNAMANQVKGAGYENTSNYRLLHREFMGIENIHVMRQSLVNVASLALV